VTPRPQPGNPKPRLFRLSEDAAVINRFGFNNDGMKAITLRLAARVEPGVVGINLGANKDSDDKARDFQTVLAHAGSVVDFATVNVSSPNTEKLRDLQGKDALTALLTGVMDTNARLDAPIPIFLKVAPDLDETQIDDIVEAALQSGINGIFATNTTLVRQGLKSPHSAEAGGLSGRPLMEPSTRILKAFADRLEGQIPLVGIGGIASAGDAKRKLEAGATAVQLYSALVYQGISLAADIAKRLDQP
jgi:dihydroorotate dehydrogenase